MRAAMQVATSCVLALLPLLIRNTIATQNPFYPYLANAFPSETLSPNHQRYLASLSPTGLNDLMGTWDLFVLIIQNNPLWPGYFLIPLALLLKKKPSRLGLLLAAFLLSSAWICGFEYKEFFIRWAGLALVVGPVMMVAVADGILHQLHPPKQVFHVAQAALVLTVAFTAFNPRYLWASLTSALDGPERNHVIRSNYLIGGAAKAWLRMNLREGETFASSGDTQTYYISHLKFESLIETP
ncbi:MAG: hypothetical protein HUU41_21165, partial [Bryobacteraceae bacterium]|nr:hypothetical protein [Bryobacteraceae bacterium]